MIVGSAPGYHESRQGLPFVGKTGQELDKLLEMSGLPSRQHLWLTNLYRRYYGEGHTYNRADYAEGSEHLTRELAETGADFIVTLGREATNWFLHDDTLSIEDVQGIAWEMDGRTVFPLVHPAAGFRSPEMASLTVQGFMALGAHLATPNAPIRRLYDDPLEGHEHYEEITTVARLDEVLAGYPGDGAVLSIDTEGYPATPFSLQFSYQPGTAYFIGTNDHGDGAGRQSLFSAFGIFLRRVRPRLLFHSALHDLGMMRAMGLPTDNLTFGDTMIQAYLLQTEPQGLKALATRHCGMRMQSYSDILGTLSDDLARDYLTKLWTLEGADHEQNRQTAFDAAKAAGKRIKVLPKIPKSDLYKAVERCLNSERPAGLWGDQSADTRLGAHARLGAMPEASLDHVDRQKAVYYGCRDADATLRVEPALLRRFAHLGLKPSVGLHQVYQLELSTYPLIDRMQRIGLKPDLLHFAALSKRLETEIATLQQTLETVTRTPGFNANSGDQVADYLYGQLGLESMKQTKGGRGSTNDKILEALEREHPEHPAVATIRSYRELFKLKNTFVDSIPDFVNRWPYDGRVHTTFRTTRVVTGRLSASDPNVLAQPEHGKFAPDFKRGWIADEGHLICQWDESQIELRGLAHLSQDPVLLRAFRNGIDLHAVLAERIFGVAPKDQDKHKHRLPAKAINFGVPMGFTRHGLSIELRKNGVDADEDTAQRWLDETFALYAGVRHYMDERIDYAKRHGYVQCLSGRIRYIGGIGSRDERVREEAERFAFSTPIQESAQFIMKQAEAQVWELLKEHWTRGDWVEPLLQVHDCLKLECARHLAPELHREMSLCMTHVPHGFSVPLAVEGEFGANMCDMESFT
jgi:uracil-DNA glycosylase family 4